MGPDTRPGVLYWADGTPATQFDEISAPDSGDEGFPPFEGFTLKIKIPKPLRCHSRKRFVKLIMGMGFSRNFANECAVWTRRAKLSYQTGLACVYIWAAMRTNGE